MNVHYRSADIVQKGAFNRCVYAFALVTIVAGIAASFPDMRSAVKPTLAIWQFLLLSSIPTLLGYYRSDSNMTAKTPNLLFVQLFWCLVVSFFMRRPMMSTGYWIFRMFLGIFLFAAAVGLTVVLLPLLAVELAWVGLRSPSTQKG